MADQEQTRSRDEVDPATGWQTDSWGRSEPGQTTQAATANAAAGAQKAQIQPISTESNTGSRVGVPQSSQGPPGERDESQEQHDDARNEEENFRDDGERESSQPAATEANSGQLYRRGRRFQNRNMPRTSCLRCKEKKMRCVPSTTGRKVCQRCEKGNHPCQYQTPDSKPRNTKLTRRIEHLEQTITQIRSNPSALLVQPNLDPYRPLPPVRHSRGRSTNSVDEAPPPPNASRADKLERTLAEFTSELASAAASNAASNTPPPYQTPQASSAYTTLPPLGNNIPLGMPHQQPPTDAFRPTPTSSYEDVIDRGLLTIPQATTLLGIMRTMLTASTFPYVIIDPTTTIHDLRRTKPMVLLSIFTAASWRDRDLQTVLEKAYLRELAERMMVRGEQTLDILQSLLIHLAWCHLHLKSAYRLTAFAISIVIGLGLNRRRRAIPNTSAGGSGPGSSKNGEFPELPRGIRGMGAGPAAVAVGGELWPPEARRAYIGTYVICSSYAHALRKTGTLKWNAFLEECALSLLPANQASTNFPHLPFQPRIPLPVPTDALLIHYVHLIHHAEDVCATFQYDSSLGIPALSDERLQFYVHSFDAALKSHVDAIPAELKEDVHLSTFIKMVSAYTHEIGLHGLSGPGQNGGYAYGSAPPALSIPRTTILVELLETVTAILKTVTNMPSPAFNFLLGFQWARVHYTLNLAVELSLGVDVPGWSLTNVRSILELEKQIDLICFRLRGIGLVIDGSKRNGEWFGFLRENWKELRSKYVEGVRRRGIHVPETDAERRGREAREQAGSAGGMTPSQQLLQGNGGGSGSGLGQARDVQMTDFDHISPLGENWNLGVGDMDFMPNEWFWMMDEF